MSAENTRGKQYSNEDLLHHLRVCEQRNGRVTIGAYNEEDDLAASSVIIERFGSWVNAKEEADVGGDGRRSNSRPRKYSTAEMIDMLQTCKARYGSASQKNFDSDDEFCSSGAVVKRFGSWSQAKKEAGINE